MSQEKKGRVAGKVTIITGGASGVGREDALLFAREGAQVVITDVNEDAGQALAREIGNDALFLRHDITREDDWQRVMAATVERFGRLDVLVNNAGILMPPRWRTPRWSSGARSRRSTWKATSLVASTRFWR